MAGILQSWWSLIGRGVLAVLFGVAVLVYPSLAASVLIIMFGIYALAQGLFTFVETARNRIWTRIVGGLLGVGVAIMSFVWPAVILDILVFFIAAWAIITGVLEISTAISLRRHMEGEWVLAASGVAALLFGIVLIIFPMTLLWLIGVFALVFGALQILIGVRIRTFIKTAG